MNSDMILILIYLLKNMVICRLKFGEWLIAEENNEI